MVAALSRYTTGNTVRGKQFANLISASHYAQGEAAACALSVSALYDRWNMMLCQYRPCSECRGRIRHIYNKAVHMMLLYKVLGDILLHLILCRAFLMVIDILLSYRRYIFTKNLFQLITASISFSLDTTLISNRCGRHIIGTAPLDTAPLLIHTLSGQSASMTQTLPFSIRIVLYPSPVCTVNSQLSDNGTVRISSPYEYICASGSSCRTPRSNTNIRMHTMHIITSITHAAIVFFVIATSLLTKFLPLLAGGIIIICL